LIKAKNAAVFFIFFFNSNLKRRSFSCKFKKSVILQREKCALSEAFFVPSTVAEGFVVLLPYLLQLRIAVSPEQPFERQV